MARQGSVAGGTNQSDAASCGEGQDEVLSGEGGEKQVKQHATERHGTEGSSRALDGRMRVAARTRQAKAESWARRLSVAVQVSSDALPEHDVGGCGAQARQVLAPVEASRVPQGVHLGDAPVSTSIKKV